MRIIIVLSVFLIGCASEVVLFDDYYIDNNVGRCFKLKKESFVYETRCTDLDKLSTEEHKCLGIQSFGIEKNGRKLTSYNQYLQEEEFWLDQLEDITAGIFNKTRRLLYEVPAGSELKIISVGKVTKSMQTPAWIIKANINNVEVALPTERAHMAPSWLVYKLDRRDIEFVEGFLEKTVCEK